MRSLEDISKTNPEKPLLLTVDGKEYYRCPIHTHLIRVGGKPVGADAPVRTALF